MSHQAIRATMLAAVKTAIGNAAHAAGVTLPISWENKAFQPPDGPWASVVYIPATAEGATLGTRGETEVRGFVQVDVNVPPNSGTKVQTDILDSMEGEFNVGQQLAYENQTVSVIRADRSASRLVDRDWRCSLTIYFYGRFQRSVVI